MATLVIVTHQLDYFVNNDGAGGLTSTYLLFDVVRHLTKFGHDVRIATGTDPVPGDVALLHVDRTIVPDEYLALAQHYPRTINFGTGDISKRTVSRMILAPGDDWAGPVIVKNDLNCGGRMEYEHNLRAARRGLPPPNPGVTGIETYRVFDRTADIPDELLADPAMVVERFVPERDGDDYAMRTWVFMGPRERCTRFVTPAAISKAAAVIRHDPAEVPAELRAERARLNFDYGKFDFVIHDGQPILLDANRTPGTATAIRELIEQGARNLAEGLHALIEGKGEAG